MRRLISFILIQSLLAMGAFCGNEAYAINFTDFINNAPGMNTDRNCNQDFYWTHNKINVSNGYEITYAEVNIKGYDIDSLPPDSISSKVIVAGRKEVDNIYAYDNGVIKILGPLIGGNGYAYTTFTLSSNFYDDIIKGLVLYIDSDALGTTPYWVMQIGSSELSVTINQTSPVPISGAIYLLGSGLIGMVGWCESYRKVEGVESSSAGEFHPHAPPELDKSLPSEWLSRST